MEGKERGEIRKDVDEKMLMHIQAVEAWAYNLKRRQENETKKESTKNCQIPSIKRCDAEPLARDPDPELQWRALNALQRLLNENNTIRLHTLQLQKTLNLHHRSTNLLLSHLSQNRRHILS
jgi:hypothetical protein